MQQQYEQQDNTIIVKVPQAYYSKDGQRRDKEPTDPDKKGGGTVDGKEYWASAWENISKSGEEYIKIKLNPKNDSQGQQYKSTDRIEKLNLAEEVAKEIKRNEELDPKPKQTFKEDDDVPF